LHLIFVIFYFIILNIYIYIYIYFFIFIFIFLKSIFNRKVLNHLNCLNMNYIHFINLLSNNFYNRL